ncbi:hypothetical protein HG619_04535 [Pseudomonas syringae]|nr:hypothetical protein [Pseudomonas syringae]
MTGVLGLAGCSVHQPTALYQLDSGEPGQPKQSSGLAVLLGPVSVADYLQRETLLQRQPDGTLTASSDGRWAGNLSSDIDQLLLRQLAWKLDSQRVVMAPATASFTPDVQVVLSITAWTPVPNSPQYWTHNGDLWTAKAMCVTADWSTEQVHAGSSADQVKAQGMLLQRLADQVSTAIKPISWQALEEPKKHLLPRPKSLTSQEFHWRPLYAPILKCSASRTGPTKARSDAGFCWALISGSHASAFLARRTVRIGRRASRTACPRWSMGTIVILRTPVLPHAPVRHAHAGARARR